MTIDSETTRARLLAVRAEIEAPSAPAGGGGLDPRSMQMQAMAKAADARRTAGIRRINAALARLDEGEYGYCTRCGEAVAQTRLEADPASPLCARCAPPG